MIHVQSSPPPAKRRLQLIGCTHSSLATCSQAIASTTRFRLLSQIKQCTNLIYCARTTAPIRTAAQATKAVDCILTLLPADDGPAPAAAYDTGEAIKAARCRSCPPKAPHRRREPRPQASVALRAC